MSSIHLFTSSLFQHCTVYLLLTLSSISGDFILTKEKKKDEAKEEWQK
jgi:hypothetical protein